MVDWFREIFHLILFSNQVIIKFCIKFIISILYYYYFYFYNKALYFQTLIFIFLENIMINLLYCIYFTSCLMKISLICFYFSNLNFYTLHIIYFEELKISKIITRKSHYLLTHMYYQQFFLLNTLDLLMEWKILHIEKNP